MAIKDIEMFHGVVFTKLLRSERPINLKMFEFNVDASTAAYLVNDEVTLYVKHSKTPRDRRRKSYERVWHFNFTTVHLSEMKKLNKNSDINLVLICGDKDLDKAREMQVCFLKPKEIEKCINYNGTETQTLTVADVKRGKLRVWGSANTAKEPLLIEKRRLDEWEVPGS